MKKTKLFICISLIFSLLFFTVGCSAGGGASSFPASSAGGVESQSPGPGEASSGNPGENQGASGPGPQDVSSLGVASLPGGAAQPPGGQSSNPLQSANPNQGGATAPSAASKAPSQGNTGDLPAAGKPAAGAQPSSSGALHVSGTRLVDSSGKAVQLKGISTHGIAWFPDYINEKCFRQLKEDWNVNVVRLAMYTAESGGYCTGGNQAYLKELIHKGVTYATAQNMYVIIDWHVLSDANPNRYLAQAKAFFAEMSAKYAGHDNVLYEICNEPNGGTSWSAIKSYAEQVIPVIRANDPDAVILVGTPNWSQYVDQAAADPITKYDNIMYTLHFYAATHTNALRNTMTAAINKGLPIFVSEYGICDASGNGGINEAQANQWVSTMNQYGVSYVAWNLSNKAETSAILRSGCKKTSGFTESDLSSSGKWLYRTLTGKNPAALPADPAPEEPATPPKEPPSAKPPAGNTGPVQGGTGGAVSYTANLQNQWESGGEAFYQYSVTVENRSATPCSSWSISIPFSGPVTVQDGWNGNYSTNGNVLTITAKDYNGSIPAGGSTGNIGFIVKGGPNMKITAGA